MNRKWKLAHLVTLSLLATLALASAVVGEYTLSLWFWVVYFAHLFAAKRLLTPNL